MLLAQIYGAIEL